MAEYLFRDQLGSVRALTNATGARQSRRVYHPFGELYELPDEAMYVAAPEDKGWIGERYDASAGLQYLNARYYDPRLGLFLQPDWFEVTEPGVGTNRYAYGFNDPVNLRDPGGNDTYALTLFGAGAAGAAYALVEPCGLFVMSAAAAAGVVAAGKAAYRHLTTDPGPNMSTEGLTATPDEGPRVLSTPIQRPDIVTEGYTAEGPQGPQALITTIPEQMGPNIVTMAAGPKNPPDIGQFTDPNNVPTPWEWRGNPDKVGSREGAWYNPVTGESLHDDRTHPEGKSAHWTYQDSDKNRWDALDDDRDNWTPQE